MHFEAYCSSTQNAAGDGRWKIPLHMLSQEEQDEVVMSLLETVMKRAPEARAAYLTSLRPDSALFEEVRKLIEQEERLGDFLLDPLIQFPAGEQLLPEGSCLGERFRILRRLGQGGMGIVYEAIDLQLDRHVALKCANAHHRNHLPPEARAAREVSHFNVCKVYDLHKFATEFGELDFLSMELIDGETLSERMSRDGSVPVSKALEIALQICSGLAQAHRQGVIHGDLKSSNIMLAKSPEGGIRAVITDFGLAKMKLSSASNVMSGRGGTLDYMAPELLRGEPVTVASDLYALGVLFHAMLKGKAPAQVSFSLGPAVRKTCSPEANTTTATLNSKFIETHSHRKIAELPSPWKKVVIRCLAVSPEDRFGSVEEVSRALTHRALWSRWGPSSGVAGALVLGWFLLVGRHESRLQEQVQLTSATDLSESASLSRDGKVIVYASDRAEAGNLDIWLQELPAGAARRLTTDSSEDNDPSISPDGGTVAFRSERNGGGIYLMDRPWGKERLLIQRGRNPQFSPDGQKIVYWTGDRNETVPSGRVYLIRATGGSPTRLAADFEDARYPIWSSDGRFILFSGCQGEGQPLPTCIDWWVVRADGTSVNNTGAIALLRQEQITPRDTLGVWRGGSVVFSGSRAGVDQIWELAISRKNLRAVGRPKQLIGGDASQTGVTIAENNSVAFGRLSGALHVWRIDHATAPGALSSTKLTGEAAIDITPNVSRNGRWLVFGRGSRNHRDVWLRDLHSGKESAFIASRFDQASPLVDNSGSTIVYELREPEASTIWLTRDRLQKKRLCVGCVNPTSWFGEGEAFFYSAGGPSKIMVMELNKGSSRVAVDGRSTSLGDADWSPANQYLLFTASPDGSRKRIYAVHFPLSDGQSAGPWIPLTEESEWTNKPRWAGDGRTIFYLSNRDGFNCVWGVHFDPVLGKPKGTPFAVVHYHNPRLSPDRVRQSSLSMAASGDSLFLNLGEETESIWTGKLTMTNSLRPLHLF
jgi:serine/threonine protein kinase